jgi:flagellar hook-associated protein 2
MAVSSTGAITSTGVGSGLNVDSIVSALMAVERQPATLIEKSTTNLKSQLSSFGQLQSYVSTLQDKVNAITDVTLWSQTLASSGDASVATVSTTSGGSPGSYDLSVQTLAKGQTLSSGTFPSASHSLGQGQLTIELGSWTGDPATFGLKTGSTSVTVQIGPGESSLAAIRDKINAAGAGVIATVINDATGARLSIRSAASGEENGFRIGVEETAPGDDGGIGLGALAYDPENQVVQGMALNESARNAKATLNGIEITSASNTLTNVVSGLTVNLLKTTPTTTDANGVTSSIPVQLSVTQDNDSVKTKINDFVTAYNDLNKFIAAQTKYDAENKTAGKLQGDRTVIALQGQMRAIMAGSSGATSLFSSLSEIGIQVQKDGGGTLQVKTSMLDNALANRADLRKLLASSDDTGTNTTGIAYRMKQLTSAVLGTDGSFETRTAGLKKTITNNDKRLDAMNERLDQTEKRLQTQYQTLDSNMSKLNSLSSYMSTQLAAIAKS